jgi:hypothetical protein
MEIILLLRWMPRQKKVMELIGLFTPESLQGWL